MSEEPEFKEYLKKNVDKTCQCAICEQREELINELNREIKELKAENVALKNKIAELEDENVKLEEYLEGAEIEMYYDNEDSR